MQRAMAKEAEAERERRRAKIVAAEGEYEASVKLGQAAEHHHAAPRGASASHAEDDGGNCDQSYLGAETLIQDRDGFLHCRHKLCWEDNR